MNNDPSITEMQTEVLQWCEAKGWKGPNSTPVTFGDCMALLHSEISEAVEAYRDRGVKAYTTPDGKPDDVGSEFADVLIRLLDDCDRYGINLATEFKRKMAYNWTRAYQHGGRTMCDYEDGTGAISVSTHTGFEDRGLQRVLVVPVDPPEANDA